MTRFQAIFLDKIGSYYEALDEDTQLWGVFGSESGFCYFTYMTEKEASNMATELNAQNDVHKSYYIKAAQRDRRQKALEKLKKLADEAGPLPISILAIGEPPKKTIWNRISSFFSGSA